MKQLTNYITEKLKITKSRKSKNIFENIQMFIQEDQFENSTVAFEYFKGIDSSNKTICYVEYFNNKHGVRFMLVVFNDDVYLDLAKQYNLEENKDLSWNKAPEELVKIVQDKLDTSLDIYICNAESWYDERYDYISSERYEDYVKNVYNELKQYE